MSILHSRKRSFSGFTLIELMIVVAIIGILAATAIPLATRYQLRSKSAEAKTNLAAIRVVEEVYFSEQGRYLAAAAEPAVIPGTTRAAFDLDHPAFSELGWNPEGDVYFSYAVAISADTTGYTVDAGADIDGDGVLQIWGYTSPTELGAIVPGGIGCDATLLTPKVIGSCIADNSVY